MTISLAFALGVLVYTLIVLGFGAGLILAGAMLANRAAGRESPLAPAPREPDMEAVRAFLHQPAPNPIPVDEPGDEYRA